MCYIKALTPLPTPTPSSTHTKTTTDSSHKVFATTAQDCTANSISNCAKARAKEPDPLFDPALKNNFYTVLATDYAVADSGCTHNYLTDKANVKTKKRQHVPIRVTLPDATTLESLHVCALDLPALPTKATEGYIIPGMKNHSLMSLTQLCNAGCKIVMNANELIVIHNGVEAMRGVKNEKNGLWYLPIRQQSKNVTYAIHDDSQQVKPTANSVYHTSKLAETIKFIHQCMFSPTLETFCKAIDNDQLIGFPPITSNQVRKFLPESTATAKGHMNRTRKGVRSTTKQVLPEYIEADFRPPIDEEANVELFIGATIAEQNEGTIYTDNTGKFPVQSYHGKRIQFVVYEYRSNAIIVKTLRDETDKSMVDAFQEVYEYLTEKGFKPKLNVMDNQCSRAVQKFIKSTGADIQLVNPDDHRVNAAERAIQIAQCNYGVSS